LRVVTNYRRGYSKERRCMDELNKRGYQTVRTAGSHGVVDVIAWNLIESRYIQVKSVQAKRVFKSVQEDLKYMHLPPHSSAELWVWLKNKGWYKQLVCQQTP